MKLLSLTLCLCICWAQESEFFSGVYNPIIQHGLEIYSGAWLMPRDLFLTKKNKIESIGMLEMTTTAIVVKPFTLGQESVRHAVMTRDYFDFQVEHLSSLTNQIDANNPEVNAYLTNITNAKVKSIRQNALHSSHSKKDHSLFRNITLAVIPFSITGAYSTEDSKDQILRENFFLLTFWSIYHHFPYIAVSVTRFSDYVSLRKMDLPYFDLYYTNISKTDLRETPRWLNSKQSLQYAYKNVAQNTSYAHFQYIYFSEGDLLLHMRQGNALFHIVNNTKYHDLTRHDADYYNDDYFILCPHRMQVTHRCAVVYHTCIVAHKQLN